MHYIQLASQKDNISPMPLCMLPETWISDEFNNLDTDFFFYVHDESAIA